MKNVETAVNDILRAAGYMPLPKHGDAQQEALKLAMRQVLNDAYEQGRKDAHIFTSRGIA